MKKGSKIAIGLLAVLVSAACIGAGITWKQLNPRVVAKTPVSSAASALSTTDVRYIAHRGFSAVAPENTLPAITEAGKAGFWGVEFDIRQTTDGKWVLMHDDYLFRMTDGLGRIDKHSYEELLEYTYDNGANIEQYPNLKIALLDDVLDECIRYGLHPYIEIKQDVSRESLNALFRLLQEKNVVDDCTILSFDAKQLQSFRSISGDLELWYLTDDISMKAQELCHLYSLHGLDFDGRRADNTPRRIKEASAGGYVLAAWTIDTIEQHDAMVGAGIRYITTNTITPE